MALSYDIEEKDMVTVDLEEQTPQELEGPSKMDDNNATTVSPANVGRPTHDSSDQEITMDIYSRTPSSSSNSKSTTTTKTSSSKDDKVLMVATVTAIICRIVFMILAPLAFFVFLIVAAIKNYKF